MSEWKGKVVYMSPKRTMQLREHFRELLKLQLKQKREALLQQWFLTFS